MAEGFRFRRAALAVALLCAATGAAAGVGPTFVHEAQLMGHTDPGAPGGEPGDCLGCAVSVSGDTAVVGARSADTVGNASGGVYVWVRSGASWSLQQRLIPSKKSPTQHFGFSVAISGDTIAVGAPEPVVNEGGTGGVDVFVRSGTSWSLQQRLTAPDAADGDRLGWSVSISGDTIVAGAEGVDSPAGVETGAAYVFVRSGATWSFQQKLQAQDSALWDRFGYSVSVAGDTAVVGSPFLDTPAGESGGAVYVFVRSGTTWTLEQELTAGDPTSHALGESVSVSGDTLIAGASPDGTQGGGGSAYVFVRSGATWSQQQKLSPSDGVPGDYFGTTASLSGESAVVGGGLGAYVFVRSGTVWSEEQKLVASDGEPGDSFARAVAIDADTVLVGAPMDETPQGVDTGSAYVFVRTGVTWSEEQKLETPDTLVGDGFANAVGLSGDTLVVGSPGDDTAVGQNAGSAYVFVRTGTSWTEQQKLAPSAPAAGAAFGSSVSISGDVLVVGAPNAGMGSGAAYVFVRSGTTWTQQQKLTASDALQGHKLGGSVSMSADTIALGAVGAAATYVFVQSGSTWTEQQKVSGSDTDFGDAFGSEVSLDGDTLVTAAPEADTPAGSQAGAAYVFVRSGTTWTEQQKLVAPDATPFANFGRSVSVDGSTAALGGGASPGSVHVFVRSGSFWNHQQKLTSPGAGLYFGSPLALLGESLVATEYHQGSNVVQVFVRSGATWTPRQGLSAPGSPINGGFGSAVWLSTDRIAVGAPYADAPLDDSAGAVHVFRPAQADLAVSKSDGVSSVPAGGTVTYTVAVTNSGPDAGLGARLLDSFPVVLSCVTSCAGTGGTVCPPGPFPGGINAVIDVPFGGAATFTSSCAVSGAAAGTLVNSAQVLPAGDQMDPNAGNNTATDVDVVTPSGPATAEGELDHGYDRTHDLAALPGPSVDTDLFRIAQLPHRSYEVVVDATSGDLGPAGPSLQRLAPDGSTIVQDSSPTGSGGSRSLRWIHQGSVPLVDEFVRVGSNGCSTDCTGQDVYRLRAWETTAFAARFNNSGTQVTVLTLQNPGGAPLGVDVELWSPSAALLASYVATVPARGTLVVNTASLAPTSSGSITVAHDGSYGQLAGKAVSVEPATGFTFDTPLVTKPR